MRLALPPAAGQSGAVPPVRRKRPPLPTIPEQAAPAPLNLQPGDRVMVARASGAVTSATVMAYTSTAGERELLLRLANGVLFPIDSPELTVLRRLA